MTSVMRSLPAVLRGDLAKLRGSLVLLILVVAPVMLFVLSIAVMIDGQGPGDWRRFAVSGAAVWAYFLLPMTATGLTALLAQIEHGPGMWPVLMSQPVPRWVHFASKILVSMALMALVSALVWAVMLGAGALAPWLRPDGALSGAMPWRDLGVLLAKMWLAGLLVTMLQLAVALRFHSFAAPVALGIGGTFIAVAATGAKAGIYFPWLLPVSMLASDAARAQFALIYGGLGGLIVALLTGFWLARREFP